MNDLYTLDLGGADYYAEQAVKSLKAEGHLRRVGVAGSALAFDELTLDGMAQVRIALAEGVVIRGATYLLIPVTSEGVV